jgi:hypothetical protein
MVVLCLLATTTWPTVVSGAASATCAAIMPHLRVSCGNHGSVDTAELCAARGCCWNNDAAAYVEVPPADDDVAFGAPLKEVTTTTTRGQAKVRRNTPFLNRGRTRMAKCGLAQLTCFIFIRALTHTNNTRTCTHARTHATNHHPGNTDRLTVRFGSGQHSLPRRYRQLDMAAVCARARLCAPAGQLAARNHWVQAQRTNWRTRPMLRRPFQPHRDQRERQRLHGRRHALRPTLGRGRVEPAAVCWMESRWRQLLVSTRARPRTTTFTTPWPRTCVLLRVACSQRDESDYRQRRPS